jgi:hypothetical protein
MGRRLHIGIMLPSSGLSTARLQCGVGPGYCRASSVARSGQPAQLRDAAAAQGGRRDRRPDGPLLTAADEERFRLLQQAERLLTTKPTTPRPGPTEPAPGVNKQRAVLFLQLSATGG